MPQDNRIVVHGINPSLKVQNKSQVFNYDENNPVTRLELTNQFETLENVDSINSLAFQHYDETGFKIYTKQEKHTDNTTTPLTVLYEKTLYISAYTPQLNPENQLTEEVDVNLIELKDSSLKVNTTLDVNNNQIINVPTPINDTNAVNKTYVDNAVAGNKTYVDNAVASNKTYVDNAVDEVQSEIDEVKAEVALPGWDIEVVQGNTNDLTIAPTGQTPILTLKPTRIISNVPVHGQDPTAQSEFATKEYVDQKTASSENEGDYLPRKAFISPQNLQKLQVTPESGRSYRFISCHPETGVWLCATEKNYQIYFCFSKDDGLTWTESPYNFTLVSPYVYSIVPNANGQWTVLINRTQCIIFDDIETGTVRTFSSASDHGTASNAVYNPLTKTIYYITGTFIGYSTNNGETWKYISCGSQLSSCGLCCNPFTGYIIAFPVVYTSQTALFYIRPTDPTNVLTKYFTALLSSGRAYCGNIAPTINGTFWILLYNGLNKLYNFFPDSTTGLETSSYSPTVLNTSGPFMLPHYYSNSLLFVKPSGAAKYVETYCTTTQTSNKYFCGYNNIGSLSHMLGGENIGFSCSAKTGTTIALDGGYSEFIYRFC